MDLMGLGRVLLTMASLRSSTSARRKNLVGLYKVTQLINKNERLPFLFDLDPENALSGDSEESTFLTANDVTK